MRGLVLFVVGTIVGVTVTAMAQNQKPNHGIVGINHVGISVPDVDKAVEYYTKTMGFPEAFRFTNPAGRQVVFVQISQNTFLELAPSNAQLPAGITHVALEVENARAATAMLMQRGAAVGETIVHSTGAIFSNIRDPNGFRLELIEFPPGSVPRQAIERWR